MKQGTAVGGRGDADLGRKARLQKCWNVSSVGPQRNQGKFRATAVQRSGRGAVQLEDSPEKTLWTGQAASDFIIHIFRLLFTSADLSFGCIRTPGSAFYNPSPQINYTWISGEGPDSFSGSPDVFIVGPRWRTSLLDGRQTSV